MTPQDAYDLGLRAAHKPADMSKEWLSKLLAAHADWPERLKDMASEAAGTAPYAILGLAKSFALERANKAVEGYAAEARDKLKQNLFGRKGSRGAS